MQRWGSWDISTTFEVEYINPTLGSVAKDFLASRAALSSTNRIVTIDSLFGVLSLESESESQS